MRAYDDAGSIGRVLRPFGRVPVNAKGMDWQQSRRGVEPAGERLIPK